MKEAARASSSAKTRATLELSLKQLHLFNGEAAPKRKLTRKRIERMAEHAVPWVKPRRPKLPTAPLWRSLAKRGMFVVEGLIEKAIPRAVAKQPTGRNGKVNYFEPFEVQTYCDVDHLIAEAFGPALNVADRRSNLDDRRYNDAVVSDRRWLYRRDWSRRFIDRRVEKSPLYIAYPLLNRRWHRRRKAKRRIVDRRRIERRCGVDRRQG